VLRLVLLLALVLFSADGRASASFRVRDSPATNQASAGTPAHAGKHRKTPCQ